MVTTASSGSLLVGTNDYLKDEAINQIVSSVLGNASRDLGLRIFYGGESTASQILDYVQTAPMPPVLKRVAVVKYFDGFSREDRAAIIKYLKSPPRYAHIILETEEISMLDECAPAASRIEVRRTGPLEASALAGWIKRYVASNSDKKIDDDAASALADMQSSGLLGLVSELDKLLSFTAAKPAITVSDVQEIVGFNREIPAFGFADAISAKDADRSLKIASELMRMGKSCQEIVGIICWQLKRMVRAKTLKDAGRSDYDAARAIGLYRKHQDDFFRQLGNFTLRELTSKMELLLDADLSIKRTRFDPAAALELAIIRLCLG